MTPSPSRASPPRIGSLPSGPRDAITDVGAVTVGHETLDEGPVQTGVTVIRPHAGDPYRDRVPAAATVLNGFGKSIGLVQVEELGALETPIALTNTYSVSAISAAQIRDCITANRESGRSLPTVNPLVFECNDGQINDIQAMAIGESHYRAALGRASAEVAEGSVGAGRGMVCFGFKGGIGTASRRVDVPGAGILTVGALVLSNYGRRAQMRIDGAPLAALIDAREAESEKQPEKGSIILVIATDAPLDARQLRRLSLRAGAGLARTGSVFGHGSGDIALAFSTAYTLPQDPAQPMPSLAMLHDGRLDPLFLAVADAAEQAILHSLWRATALPGRDGRMRHAITDTLPDRAGL